MNIFYLSHCPQRAAKYQYNKHVVKMVLETAQLLATAHHQLGKKYNYPTTYVPYRETHRNHPTAIWVRESLENYMWTYEHMMALGEEYTKRYNKSHLTIEKCRDIFAIPPRGINLEKEFTPPPQVMPEEYHSDNTVESYWRYYINEKQHCCAFNEQKHFEILETI